MHRQVPRNSGHGSCILSIQLLVPLPTFTPHRHPFQACTCTLVPPSTITASLSHVSSCTLLCPAIIPGIHFHNCLPNLLHSFTPYSWFYAPLHSILLLVSCMPYIQSSSHLPFRFFFLAPHRNLNYSLAPSLNWHPFASHEIISFCWISSPCFNHYFHSFPQLFIK